MTISFKYIKPLLTYAVFFVLFVALAQQVTRLFWLLQTSSTPIDAPKIERIELLTGLNFTVPKPQNPAKDSKPIHSTKSSNATFSLQGVYFEKNSPEESLAMISVNGTTKPFALGENLIDNVVLKSIKSDHVVISDNGVTSTHSLPENILEDLTSFVEESDSILPSIDNKERKKNKPKLELGLSDSLKKLLINNPMQLMQHVSITPQRIKNLTGKPIEGLKVTSRTPNLLNSVGLAENDILVKLNQRDASPENLMQLLADIKKGKKINAKIYREGRMLDIKLNL